MVEETPNLAEGVPERECSFQIPMIERIQSNMSGFGMSELKEDFEKHVTGYKCSITGLASAKTFLGVQRLLNMKSVHYDNCDPDLCPQYQTWRILKDKY